MHLIGVHVIGAVHVIGPPVKDVKPCSLKQAGQTLDGKVIVSYIQMGKASVRDILKSQSASEWIHQLLQQFLVKLFTS